MAASHSSARTSSSADDATASGVGMAHLTVVPANFESEDGSAENE